MIITKTFKIKAKQKKIILIIQSKILLNNAEFRIALLLIFMMSHT